MSDRTNEDWLRDLRGDGADAAIAALRGEVLRGLRRALSGRAGVDDALIEDVTQEAMVRVLAGLGNFRGDSRLTTWAVTVAVRVAFTELRRARWKDVSLDQLTDEGRAPAAADGGPGPEEHAARASVLRVMRRVIDTELTDRQRRGLMAELKGMPVAEVAGQMGLSRNAVYKLTHDARQKVKAGLESAGVTADEVREAFGL